jgi:signal transduction histidine kinase
VLRRFQSWLGRIPVDDPVDHRNAIFMQCLLLFEGLRTPLNKIYLASFHWTYLLDRFYSKARSGTAMAIAIDLGTDLAMTVAAWLGLYLIRTGKFRPAVAIYLTVVVCSGALAYAAFGYRATDGSLTLIMVLALSGMMLGRQALWITYAAEALVLIVSVAPTAILQAPHVLPGLVAVYNALPMRALMSYLLIAVILDRSVNALRASLAEANAQRRQLSLEIAERERAHEQLLHAQKMDAIGELTSGIAHDINNVFCIILGFSTERDRLTADALSDEDIHVAADAMEGMELAARRGAAVCRKLLNFSRSDATNAETFDMDSALQELRPLLRQLLPPSIDLEMRSPDCDLPIHFDRSQLELAIINLVSNARDAMPGGGTCTLYAEREGPHVTLSIRDTGLGMSASTKAKVFEPFFTTKPMGSGTGLGLSVVYDLIQRAGGDIRVESELGEGSIFRVRLPIATAAAMDIVAA